MRTAPFGFALLIGFAGAAASAQTAPSYHVTKTVALGAPDRWDYLVYDAPSHRLYVSHGDRVTVLDGKGGEVIGNIEGMPGGTHGIGIVTAMGKGYTDDGKAGEAVAFDLKTLKTGKHIKAEDDADGIAFDPASGHIFVVDGDSKLLTVVDPKTDTAIATINAGGGLEYAVSGNNGKLYVDGAENKEIVRIDTATNKVDARWPIPGCTNPHGLAIDTKAQRLFASCVNSVLTVVNAQSGAVVATLPIGKGTDGAAFDPKDLELRALVRNLLVSVLLALVRKHLETNIGYVNVQLVIGPFVAQQIDSSRTRGGRLGGHLQLFGGRFDPGIRKRACSRQDQERSQHGTQ